MATFSFNCRKMTQALAVLMKQPGKDQDNYYKLLKLLYISERESLVETGHPITGDKLVAMPHGPALSKTCDLMRGQDSRPEWSSCIQPIAKKYSLVLVADPGEDLLCDYEIEKLKDVSARYSDKTWREMHRICHTFPEQKKNDPGKSSKDIPFSDIITSPKKLRAIEAAADAQAESARTFGR